MERGGSWFERTPPTTGTSRGRFTALATGCWRQARRYAVNTLNGPPALVRNVPGGTAHGLSDSTTAQSSPSAAATSSSRARP